jgi:hypothetical protein
MSYLDLNLDEDDGIEPENPLGRINLIGEEGRLVEDNLMLDTFLEALIAGLSRIAVEDIVSIDTVDEPHLLVLRRCGDGVKIAFGDQEVLVEDRGTLNRELVVAVTDLLRRLDDAALASNQRPLGFKKLRTFLEDEGAP